MFIDNNAHIICNHSILSYIYLYELKFLCACILFCICPMCNKINKKGKKWHSKTGPKKEDAMNGHINPLRGVETLPSQ